MIIFWVCLVWLMILFVWLKFLDSKMLFELILGIFGIIGYDFVDNINLLNEFIEILFVVRFLIVIVFLL